jgi:ribosomal protein L11 methyltransferase
VLETVAARDWVAASLAGLKPVAAGRFLVHGAHDRARVPAHRIGIEIEAALAFGTGHHGTTRGCLLALDAWLKRRRHRLAPSLTSGSALARRPGRALPRKRGRGKTRVLDIGTGTGVLAIAAAKALHARVTASDIDRCAVEVARANARANAAGPLVDVVHAGGLAARRLRERGPFDLVLANILLPPLRRLAAPIARALAPGGHVILSGLLATQAPAAIAAYRMQGLELEASIPLDEWITLMLVRRGTRKYRE